MHHSDFVNLLTSDERWPRSAAPLRTLSSSQILWGRSLLFVPRDTAFGFFLFMLHKSGTKRRSYTTSLVSNHSSGFFMFLFFLLFCCCCVIYILPSPLLFYSFYSLMWLSIVSALLCVLPKDLWIERCFRNNLASFLYRVTQTTDPVAP